TGRRAGGKRGADSGAPELLKKKRLSIWPKDPTATSAPNRFGDAGPHPTVSRGSAVALLCFFSSRRRRPRLVSDWSSDVCSSDLVADTDLLRKVAPQSFGNATLAKAVLI